MLSPQSSNRLVRKEVELFFKNKRKDFLIHHLDREAFGIVVVAHDKNAAAGLSRLFQSRQIIKRYRARVLGDLTQKKTNNSIQLPLDGNSAITEYEAVHYDSSSNTTLVDLIIRTGRKHQIRRHFEMIGFPVMGDPRYGTGNKNTAELKLTAIALEFECPFCGKYRVFNSPTAA